MFFREVTASYKGLDRLRSAAASIRDYGSGALRIGSLSAMGSTLVARAVQRFRLDNPKIKITLQVTSSASIRNMVADGNLDIGLAADEIDKSGVDAQLFVSIPGVIALAADHPLTAKPVLTPADIAAYPFIGLAPEDRARLRLDAVMAAAGESLNIVVETPSSNTICALALSGDAIGLVNPISTEGFSERGLVLRPFVPDVSFRALILSRPDAQKARLVRAFTTTLYEMRNRLSFATEQ